MGGGGRRGGREPSSWAGEGDITAVEMCPSAPSLGTLNTNPRPWAGLLGLKAEEDGRDPEGSRTHLSGPQFSHL